MKSILKNILSLGVLFTLILTACSKKEPVNYAIVSGVLDNAEGKEVRLRASVYVPIGEKPAETNKLIKVEKDGSFTDTIYLKKDGDFVLIIDRGFVTINLTKGDHLYLTADAENLPSTIEYKGKAAPINNYLIQYQKLFKEENKKYQRILKLEEPEFIKTKENYKNSMYQMFGSCDGLTEDFITAKKKDLHYNTVSSYLNHAERHGKAIGNENYKPSPNFLDIVNTVDYNDSEEFKRSLQYGFLLKKYYTYQYAQIGDVYKEDRVNFIQYLDRTISDNYIKEELLFLYGAPTLTSTKEVQLCYDILNKNITNKEYRNILNEKYNQLKLIQPKQDSPTFTDLQNVDGGTNSLTDYKGKFVYIDVWATWCGPCKAEFPYLKKVEEKYNDNKKIVFIGLSIDTFKVIDKWKAFVKKNQLGGVQLIAGDDRSTGFVGAYQIEGIPRFILIDPDGKIVDADAPRPSDEKLIQLFNELGI